ncbi:alpha/beta fold hydrolase [Atlantibacter hermannii]|uniref:alpha/beta fold hydrolase n=1 Tax=Atlantibacter hermannii TaxID=565 RepID=UPI00406D1656
MSEFDKITLRDGSYLYFKDWGSGQPIVFSHGWPLTADAFEDQMLFLGQQGYRVIAHDRRGPRALLSALGRAYHGSVR